MGTIGNNLKFYSSGWLGNQFVKTASLSKLGKIGGNIFVAGSVVTDYVGWQNGAISGQKFALDLTMDAVGFAGPVGAGVAGAYYIGDTINTYYPGGLEGALNDYSNTATQFQELTGHSFLLPGKISFHPNLAPRALPSSSERRKKKWDREVLDPYDLLAPLWEISFHPKQWPDAISLPGKRGSKRDRKIIDPYNASKGAGKI